MNDFLKGNFTVKRPIQVKDSDEKTEGQKIAEELKKKAMNNLGGSMVYVDRTELVWDGDDSGKLRKS